MNYSRILTLQDISCVGQCSMTVALPVLSACGQEACALPSAVLSTHTGGFSKPAVRELTVDFSGILAHWQRENIRFDAIYTGYLGDIRQIEYAGALFDSFLRSGGKRIVDPAMADNGKLYTGFDGAYVEAMKQLCSRADVILPNITEACLLTGMEYREKPDWEYVSCLLEKLHGLGCPYVVLTGVGFSPKETGVLLSGGRKTFHYTHSRLGGGCHGTGDAFASAFTGAWMSGRTMEEAARIGADFVCACIRETREDPSHWYGARFERAIPFLVRQLYGDMEAAGK